jgi:hypothetical protein
VPMSPTMPGAYFFGGHENELTIREICFSRLEFSAQWIDRLPAGEFRTTAH